MHVVSPNNKLMNGNIELIQQINVEHILSMLFQKAWTIF
jgi:hypothetical protein